MLGAFDLVDVLRDCLSSWRRRTVMKPFLNVFRQFNEIDFRNSRFGFNHDPVRFDMADRSVFVQGIKALVPRVIGQSEAAREQKARSSPSRSRVPAVRLNRETFLNICPPEAADFFAKVLDEATNRGLRISWGTQSFSIKKEDQPPFVWCYAKTGNFEIFDKDLPEEKATRLRSQLATFPSAKQTGKFTVRMYVTHETLSDAEKAWDVVLQTILG